MNRALSITERVEIRESVLEEAKSRETDVIGKRVRWEEEVEALARKIAIGVLGIEKDLAALETLEKQISALEEKRNELTKKIQKQLPRKDRDHRYDDVCDVKMGICEAINKLSEASTTEAMKAHPVGKKILEIRGIRDQKLTALQKCPSRESVDEKRVLDWEG